MATGSGLDAQVGVGIESVWGTPVTPDRFYEFNSEGLAMDPSWLEPTALRSGIKYKRESRVRQSRRTVGGDLVLEHATRGMGRLWKHILGSAVGTYTQIAATTAYAANFVPGDYRGLGLTIQVGRPEPGTGTVRPYTYAGCKCTGWQFSVRDQEVPQLSLTLDGRSEATATGLAVASYIAGSGVFDFSQASLKLGGTPSTAAGRTTIAGGAAVSTVVREFSVAGEVPMATERFGLGNAGLKSEPLENDTPTVTGSLGAEFNQADLYAAFAAGTTTAMEMRLTGVAIGASAEFETLEIIMPAVKMKKAAPNVGGPDIVEMTTEFEAYSNGVDPTIQVRIITPETTI